MNASLSSRFTRNPTVKIQRKPVIRSESVKVTEAKAWMTQYFKRIGDSMPHVEQTHLPHGLTKQDIYQIMKREILQQGVSSTISLHTSMSSGTPHLKMF